MDFVKILISNKLQVRSITENLKKRFGRKKGNQRFME